jgi:hypothetical protein
VAGATRVRPRRAVLLSVAGNLVGCDIHNADRIVPELQDLRVGYVIRLVPEDFVVPLYYRVLHVEPPTLLVLGPGGGDGRGVRARPALPWALDNEHAVQFEIDSGAEVLADSCEDRP